MKKALLTLSLMISVIWLAKSQVVITEIMFNPPESGTDSLEFIELYNSGSNPVDLNGFSLYFNTLRRDTFTTSTILGPGNILVIAVNDTAVHNQFNLSFYPRQWSGAGLSNTGALITLNNPTGVEDSVRYSNTWEQSANALGYSLILCDPATDNALQANWDTTSTVTGNFINSVALKGSPGVLESCVIAPVLPYTYYGIGQINTSNSLGVADNIGVKAELRGIVHSIDFDGTAGYDITLIDYNHDGISLFSTNDQNGYTASALGDSLVVKGTISQFNGLTQLVVDSVFFISAANTLLSPIPVNLPLDESKENKLVSLAAVTLVNPSQWTGTGTGFNVDVTDGTNNWVVRIDNDCIWYGLPAPSGQIDIVGTVNQFDTLSPFDAGYQIRPRIITDITTQASAPTVFFTGSSMSVNENAGTVTLTLNILNPDANATTVDVRIGTTSTASASDYTNFTLPTTVTFPASSSATQQVTIDIVDDALVESAETIVLELFNATNNAILGNDSVYTITVNDNDVAPTPLVKLVFNEIMYNNPGADSIEFIEIYNNDTVTVDLAGYQVTSGIFITFPSHQLAPGGYVVITQDSVLFQQRFGVTAYRWNTGNTLNNTGEALLLKNNQGVILDSIFYRNAAPWPTGPAGNGPSAQLCDPNSDNNDGANWRTSIVQTGAFVNNVEILATPGASNGICRATYPLTSIGNVDNVDANGVPDSTGLDFEIRGIVHCSDFRVGNGLEFYLINYNNEGVKVFSPFDRGYSVNEGDSLHVFGTVNQLSGTTEFRADTLFLISSANATLNPTVITNALSENEEGSFIRFNNVTLSNPTQWTGAGTGFNVDVTNGTNTWQVRIDDGVDLFTQAAPTGNFNIYGIGGQFDASSPYTSGYQLIACSSSITIVSGTQDLELNEVVLFPNPTSDFIVIRAMAIENISVSNLLGQAVINLNNVDSDISKIDLSELTAGVYNVSVVSNGHRVVKQIVKR